ESNHNPGARSFYREENAMMLILLISNADNVLVTMQEKTMQLLVDSLIEYAEEIRRSDHYIVSDALQRFRTARTLVLRTVKRSTLIRLLGGFELAEEALHEAFAAAVEQWPFRFDGVAGQHWTIRVVGSSSVPPEHQLIGHGFQNNCDGMRNARLKREDAFSHAMIIVSSAMVSSS